MTCKEPTQNNKWYKNCNWSALRIVRWCATAYRPRARTSWTWHSNGYQTCSRRRNDEESDGDLCQVLITLYFAEYNLPMSVKVAVRVRPFNQREIFLNSLCCVEMQDGKTRLLNADGHNGRERLMKRWADDNSHLTIASGRMTPIGRWRMAWWYRRMRSTGVRSESSMK